MAENPFQKVKNKMVRMDSIRNTKVIESNYRVEHRILVRARGGETTM